jgi:hypothetical protein
MGQYPNTCMIISKEHQILVNKKISRVLILYSDNVKLYSKKEAAGSWKLVLRLLISARYGCFKRFLIQVKRKQYIWHGE